MGYINGAWMQQRYGNNQSVQATPWTDAMRQSAKNLSQSKLASVPKNPWGDLTEEELKAKFNAQLSESQPQINLQPGDNTAIGNEGELKIAGTTNQAASPLESSRLRRQYLNNLLQNKLGGVTPNAANTLNIK